MRCIGFGEFEGDCEAEAGSTHSGLWCQRCDDLRRAHIDARMKEIMARFDPPDDVVTERRPEGEW